MKRLLIAALLCACPLFGQNASPTPQPKIQFFDQFGAPLAGGMVFTYAAGTTTPQATYTDSTGNTPNTNPVVLDAGGYANIWLENNFCYKLVVQNAQGVQISSTDNVCAPLNSGSLDLSSPPPIGNVAPNTGKFTNLTVTGTCTGCNGIPAGGTTNQQLVKASNADYDAHWVDPEGSLPTGGATAQVLNKTSSSDFAVGWSTPHYIPNGGNGGYVLEKNSNSDYDVAWEPIPQTGVVYSWQGMIRLDVTGFQLTYSAAPENLTLNQITVYTTGTFGCTVTFPVIDVRRLSDNADITGNITLPAGMSQSNPLNITSLLVNNVTAADQIRVTVVSREFGCSPTVAEVVTFWQLAGTTGSISQQNTISPAQVDALGGIYRPNCSALGSNYVLQGTDASGNPQCIAGASLPTQTNNQGRVLSTDGTNAAWVGGLPVYTPHQLGLLANGSDEGAALQTALNNLHTSGGAVIQLQAGDTLNAGTTAIVWPTQIWMRGTGREGSGQWGTFTTASSYLTTACTDPLGCFKFEDVGSSGLEDLAIRAATCEPFLYDTQTLLTVRDVSLNGHQGGLGVNTACNDGVILGQNINTCLTNENCYFTGYGGQFDIYTNNIRRALVGNTATAFVSAYVHGSSTDSNSTADAVLMQGACNDSGNKCGFSSLVCSTSDVITLGSFNGGGSGAAATVACTGTNAIANGTAIIVTARGSGYTSAPTSATGTCGGDTCTGSAALTTLALGPFIELLGYSGGGINAIQNHITVDGELGNAGSHTNPGDAHFSTILKGDYATDNEATVVADDSANSPYSSVAAIVMTSNAQSNKLTCLYYQTSLTKCFSDANSGSHANIYFDVPVTSVYSRYIYPVHVGSGATPVNDITYGAYTVGTLPTPSTYMTAWVSDGSTATDCTVGSGSNKVWCYYNGASWTAIVSSATTSVNVNSSSVSSPNFNDSTPAAATDGYNLKWQHSGSNVSGYIPQYGTIKYGFSFQGAVGASATGLIQVADAATLPANLATPTTTCKCGTNPTSSFAITLKDGGSTVGTITLNSSCSATLATTGGTTQALAADDQLYAIAPGSADATAANISCLVRATRN